MAPAACRNGTFPGIGSHGWENFPHSRRKSGRGRDTGFHPDLPAARGRVVLRRGRLGACHAVLIVAWLVFLRLMTRASFRCWLLRPPPLGCLPMRTSAPDALRSSTPGSCSISPPSAHSNTDSMQPCSTCAGGRRSSCGCRHTIATPFRRRTQAKVKRLRLARRRYATGQRVGRASFIDFATGSPQAADKRNFLDPTCVSDRCMRLIEPQTTDALNRLK